MAAKLAVDVQPQLNLEESLVLVAAVFKLPDSWSVTIREASPPGPALEITLAGPGFITVGGVRRETFAADAVALMSQEHLRRGE